MKNLHTSLDQNMQEIYRKAVDADTRLNELKKQGLGKFASIFTEQSAFRCNEKTFMPYVAELTEDVARFRDTEDNVDLAVILNKMEQLHKVLAALKNITKSN